MAKTSIPQYDTTPSNNTDVGGIGILGTNKGSNLDDAIRTIMAHLKDFQMGAVFGGPILLPTGTSGVAFVGDPDTTFGSDTANTAYIKTANSTRVLFENDITSFFTNDTKVRGTQFLIGDASYTGTDLSDPGITMKGPGALSPGAISATVDGGNIFSANRLSSNGNLISFYRDTTFVAAISGTTTTITYGTSSDERLKENFADFDAGTLIDAMKMYRFDWKSGGSGYGPKAQELYQVFPDGVVPGNNVQPGHPDFQPWNWGGNPIIAVLIREIQSLRARLAAAGL